MYVCVLGPEGGATDVDALAGEQLRSRYRWCQRQSDGYTILIRCLCSTLKRLWGLFISFPFFSDIFCPQQDSTTAMVGSCCQMMASL